jgi:hypothetical protein
MVTVLIVLATVGCSGPEETPPPTEKPSPTSAPTERPTATATPTAIPTTAPTSTPRPTLTPSPTPLPPPTPTPTVPSLDVLAEQDPELASLLQNPEVDAAYKDMLVAYEQRGPEAAMGIARQRGILTSDGNIQATLALDTQETASTVAQLQSLGAQVTGTSGNRIDVAMPMQVLMGGGNQGQLLNQFSGLDHVIGVMPPQ